MPYIPLTQGLDFSTLGRDAYALATRLFPICRSITGEGIRRTLAEIRSVVPLELHEIPTGTEILDWTVPREWNIRDACITDLSGRRIIDFRAHNLHVVSYSIPIRARMHLDDLKAHLHTLPDHPDWIPYRTSYYKETWGFCLTQRQLDAFTDDTYDVCIDSTLEEGHLTYGEYYLSGETTDEMLISCHACHPSLANDNLSGVAVSALLARIVSSRRNRLSYRFLFLPGTIGSISWLARLRPVWAIRGSFNTSRAVRVKRSLIAWSNTFSNRTGSRTTSDRFLRMDTTSVSIARPDSICRSGA
jgi:aminopeptidase-like protein